jgi:F-type H+-transporting ATPase subunit delta
MIDAGRSIARSLLREVLAAGEMEQTVADLSLLARIASDPAVRRFLGHPLIRHEEKERVLSAAVSSAVAHRLVVALVQAQATGLLPAIAESFGRLVQRETGFVETVARVAQPLPPAQEEEIRAAVKAATGMTPVMKVQVDPQLIGGVRLVIDGRVADNSLKSELERLKESLQAQ